MDLEDGRRGPLLGRQDSLDSWHSAISSGSGKCRTVRRVEKGRPDDRYARRAPRGHCRGHPNYRDDPCSDGLDAARMSRRGRVRDARRNAGSLKSMPTDPGLTIAAVPGEPCPVCNPHAQLPGLGLDQARERRRPRRTPDASVRDSLRTRVNAEKTLCKGVSLGGLAFCEGSVTASIFLYRAGFFVWSWPERAGFLSGPGQRVNAGRGERS